MIIIIIIIFISWGKYSKLQDLINAVASLRFWKFISHISVYRDVIPFLRH